MTRLTLTPAQRQARHKALGRVVAVTLKDADAIAALDAARAAHGSIRAGLEAALASWAALNVPAAPKGKPGRPAGA